MIRKKIDPKDIRKGDLIRIERHADLAGVERAVEYLAPNDCHEHPGLTPRVGSYYLLNRPVPSVVLPSRPTLGWVDGEDGRMLARWVQHSLHQNILVSDSAREGLEAHKVAAFTPATAVPTEALEILRASPVAIRRSVGLFFEAIDEANA